jgi:hypothetical protein
MLAASQVATLHPRWSYRPSRRSPGAAPAFDRNRRRALIAEITAADGHHSFAADSDVSWKHSAAGAPNRGHFNIRALRAIHQQRIADKATAARLAVFRRAEVIQRLSWIMTGKSSTP